MNTDTLPENLCLSVVSEYSPTRIVTVSLKAVRSIPPLQLWNRMVIAIQPTCIGSLSVCNVMMPIVIERIMEIEKMYCGRQINEFY